MKDLARIEHITRDLRFVWMQNSELRLGQLMENLFGCGQCMYHRDDQLIADALVRAKEEGLAVVLNDRPE